MICSSLPYSFLILDSPWKTLARNPNLMVPPNLDLSISGMYTTAWVSFGESGLNSSEVASATPTTERTNSMTEIWKPKQTPKKGMLFSRAHLAADIIPSVPLVPNPPGTKIPSAQHKECQALWNLTLSSLNWDSGSKSEASTQMISKRRRTLMEECSRALITDKYESFKCVYFPTRAIFTVSKERSKELQQLLLHQQQRHVIGGVQIMNGNDLVWTHVAEHGDLLNGWQLQLVGTTAGNDIWSQTKRSQVLDGSLSRFGLLLTVDHRNQRHVTERKVLMANTELELSQGLNERSGLNVTNSTTQLNDTNVWL
ncbi:hypothetical protein WICPIJ_004691 [Wickerhamomyces pijperi]|uniref:Uncharacterized protein n=1 Tax=Wickerhamomyces pijperi TaxID=599730 RepID=A0A9P8Q753_WICPI|nr:hypothetical protein WICPIJ_004691 [Wickerhamomyces pijperi]